MRERTRLIPLAGVFVFTFVGVVLASGCEAVLILAAGAAEPRNKHDREEYWSHFPTDYRPLEYAVDRPY